MKTTFLATLISGFSLLFVSVQPIWAEQATSTPVQIVQEWINSYPHRLERAVMFTSPAMRKDLTPNQWIRAKKKLLAAVKLNYKNRQIVSVRNDGYQVVITLITHISTIHGEKEQWEQITLKPFCSIWLIDEIKVKSVPHLTQAK
ncbi:MAG: hypothetical protein VST68_00435 [Nitrospirota bacterium]|nr:hypothetical protein [Nitrospirota bacterium]